MDRQLDLILKILPGVKRLGFVYNSGEDNSVSSPKQLKEEASKRGIETVEATVSKFSGVWLAAKSPVRKVDAIHIPTQAKCLAQDNLYRAAATPSSSCSLDIGNRHTRILSGYRSVDQSFVLMYKKHERDMAPMSTAARVLGS